MVEGVRSRGGERGNGPPPTPPPLPTRHSPHVLDLGHPVWLMGHMASCGHTPPRGRGRGRQGAAASGKHHTRRSAASPPNVQRRPVFRTLSFPRSEFPRIPTMQPRAEPGNVRVLARIGGGSFGSVYKVRLRDTGAPAVLKQVSLVGLGPSEQVRGWSLNSTERTTTLSPCLSRRSHTRLFTHMRHSCTNARVSSIAGPEGRGRGEGGGVRVVF